MCFFPPQQVQFCATAKKPSFLLCSTSCIQWTRSDRSQRNAKLSRHVRGASTNLLCCCAVFLHPQRSSHSQSSGMKLPLELTPSPPSQLTLPSLLPQTSTSGAPKPFSDCCVCWDHKHHFIYCIEKQFAIQIFQ